jgi:hypothetical protein
MAPKIFAQSREAQDEPITLPVTNRDGTVEMYTIEPLPADKWIVLVAIEKAQRRLRLGQDLAPGDKAELDKMGEKAYGELAVGQENFKRLLESDIHPDLVLAVIVTAAAYHIRGVAAAEASWEVLAVNPPQPAEVPNRVARRRAARNGSKPKVKATATPKQDLLSSTT